MKSGRLGVGLAIIVVFLVGGVTVFADGVRTVQVVGLLACGAAAGAALTRIIITRRSGAEQAHS